MTCKLSTGRGLRGSTQRMRVWNGSYRSADLGGSRENKQRTKKDEVAKGFIFLLSMMISFIKRVHGLDVVMHHVDVEIHVCYVRFLQQVLLLKDSISVVFNSFQPIWCTGTSLEACSLEVWILQLELWIFYGSRSFFPNWGSFMARVHPSQLTLFFISLPTQMMHWSKWQLSKSIVFLACIRDHWRDLPK